jgi:hypothetical protein
MNQTWLSLALATKLMIGSNPMAETILEVLLIMKAGMEKVIHGRHLIKMPALHHQQHVEVWG